MYLPLRRGQILKLKAQAQFLADGFARNGFNVNTTWSKWTTRRGEQVVIPDLFNGDPVPPDALSGTVSEISYMEVLLIPLQVPFDHQTWSGKQLFAAEIVSPVVRAFETQGISKFAFTGYCCGGKSYSQIFLTSL